MMEVVKWCPNCEYFFKEYGLNCCQLVNWRDHPLDGGNQAVLGWLELNQSESTAIHPGADNCPGFVPYAQLMKKIHGYI